MMWTREHQEAFYRKYRDKRALELRAECCDFMAETSTTEHARMQWEESARRRRAEAGAME